MNFEACCQRGGDNSYAARQTDTMVGLPLMVSRISPSCLIEFSVNIPVDGFYPSLTIFPSILFTSHIASMKLPHEDPHLLHLTMIQFGRDQYTKINLKPCCYWVSPFHHHMLMMLWSVRMKIRLYLLKYCDVRAGSIVMINYSYEPCNCIALYFYWGWQLNELMEGMELIIRKVV